MHIYVAKDSKNTPLQTHFGNQHLRKRGNAAVSTIFIYKIRNSDKLACERFRTSHGGQRHVTKGGTMPRTEDGSDWLVFKGNEAPSLTFLHNFNTNVKIITSN
jgi:hypothetical protein